MAKSNSEFEKRFPKPDYEGNALDHWKIKCEGWLEFGKWIIQVAREHGTMYALDKAADELEALEHPEKDS
jgi:hypothetical protein